MSDLGGSVSAKRQRENLTLREAGKQAGVAFSTLGRIENGQTPSLAVFHRIKAWLEGATPILAAPPMTLRDWFAGQALAGLAASDVRDGQQDAARYAKDAFCVADAMLSFRQGGE